MAFSQRISIVQHLSRYRAARSSRSEMPGADEARTRGLLAFPAELKISVLSFALLNSAQDCLNLARSCSAMFEAYKENKSQVYRFILAEVDPRNLAIAKAHYYATALIPKLGNRHLLQRVEKFCCQHLSKQGTGLPVPLEAFPAEIVTHIGETDAAVHAIAVKLAPDIVSCKKYKPDPTPTELSKISKSLYIIDIIQLLFPKKPRKRWYRHDEDAFAKFWSFFAPWESVQVETLSILIRKTVGPFIYTSKGRPFSSGPDPWRSLLGWNGMKELAPLICHGQWNTDDIRLDFFGVQVHEDSRYETLFGSHSEPWIIRPCWFTVARKNYSYMKLSSDFFNQYDAHIDDTSARVWLWGISHWASMGHSRHRTFAEGDRWYGKIGHRSTDFPLFWDFEHIMDSCGWRLPQLQKLIRDVGAGAFVAPTRSLEAF
ncbi:hypothetical protein GGR55DRAFT_695975 [Xylaria sp. FL0064]|nr:hypothetical protein GGR55DRAFT_695975 [Xylaria sp. FL0064]